MKVLWSTWILLTVLAGVSIQQCTIDDLQSFIRDRAHSKNFTINSTYYNCLSTSDSGNNYSSASVSILYTRLNDSMNIKEVRLYLKCNYSVWKVVEKQSSVLRNNNTRYCEDCTDQNVNMLHCIIG